MKHLEKIKQPTFIFILLLLAASWWGVMDSLAVYVNGESIKDAAIIYGVARAINATISVMQSAEVSVFVASAHPGELLDPLNDFIERFSSVMTWSLSSLVLQKILLAVFSSYLFKIIFTMFCVAMLLVRWFQPSTRLAKRAWTFFLIIASLRFSIAIVCGLTALIDYSFIQSMEQKNLREVQIFSDDISNGANDLAFIDDAINKKLNGFEIRKGEIISQITTKESDLDNLEKILGEEPKRSVIGVVSGAEKSKTVQFIEKQIDDKKIEIRGLKAQLKTVESEIKCVVKQKEGKSCDGFFAKLKDTFSTDVFDGISQKVNDVIINFVTVLGALVLTTIVLPLIFLYLSFKLFRFFVSSVLHLEQSPKSMKNPSSPTDR